MKPTLLFATTYEEKDYPFLRQIPVKSDHWCRFQFTTDPDHPNLFGCVVYDNITTTITPDCPRSHCLLITGEPPSLRTYRTRFTSQFGAVRTSHADLRHFNKTLDHEGQPWYYGLGESDVHGSAVDYDFLCSLPRPTKPRRISVIASNKVTTEDHRQRLRFVEQLKAVFPDELDVFGRGIRSVRDKADAIYPYDYHIVLENDHSPYYVSEKLTDSFLGWAFPLYSGSSHADALLPQGSFERIDMHRPEKSIETIRQILRADVAENRFEIYAEARKKVIRDLNLFSIIEKHFSGLATHASREKSIIYPKNKTFHQIIAQLRRGGFNMLRKKM